MSGADGKLLSFVSHVTQLVSRNEVPEAVVLDEVDRRMRELVASDDWLPDDFAASHPLHYQQYLLYGDPLERFSVVSFVWGPGQATPIHNHTVWGVIGMLRGAEYSVPYALGPLGAASMSAGTGERLEPGSTARLSLAIGDVHKVCNAFEDRVSISIHVYGANIGRVRRHAFDPLTGATKDFVSGYANKFVPNLWTVSRS